MSTSSLRSDWAESPTPNTELPASGSRPVFETASFAGFARVAAGLGAALFVVGVLRFGWMSDDGFITVRSIENLAAGRGLVLNVGQRVQTFTSPLWTLLCTPLFALAGKNPYAALMLGGLLSSAALVGLVLHAFRRTPGAAAFVFVALSASTSVLTFCTSGLENSLAHVLVASFCLERLRKKGLPTRSGFVLGALLLLTRFDLALFVAPVWGLGLVRHPGQSLRRAAVGALLVLAWLAFATLYFGFPLPNTAYAKLNTGIALASRAEQGLAYLVDAAYRDPVLVCGLLAAFAWTFVRRTPPAVRALLAGVVGYVAYVIWIGGDFMSGRFLTVPFVATAVVFGHRLGKQPGPLVLLAAALLVPSLQNLEDRRANVTKTECSIGPSGIVDERACYVEHTGLAQNIRAKKWKSHGYLREYAKATKRAEDGVVVFDLVGMAAFAEAPRVHVVERFALSDPLLARIEFPPNGSWRPGHFRREVPRGYLASLRSGENRIEDPCLHALYDDLRLVTSGSLLSGDRLRAIARLNTSSATCPSPE